MDYAVLILSTAWIAWRLQRRIRVQNVIVLGCWTAAFVALSTALGFAASSPAFEFLAIWVAAFGTRELFRFLLIRARVRHYGIPLVVLAALAGAGLRLGLDAWTEPISMRLWMMEFLLFIVLLICTFPWLISKRHFGTPR